MFLRTFKLTGEAQDAAIIMKPDELQIDELYVNVPYVFFIEMENTANVQAGFCWKKVGMLMTCAAIFSIYWSKHGLGAYSESPLLTLTY